MKRPPRARSRSFPNLAGLVFDVDGTLLLSDRSLGGYELLPGAAETLQELNARNVPFVLQPMERLAQLVIVPVVQARFNVVDEFPPSERGEGGYGSTGKH